MATLCYTSGTTGTPKGAVLTHANLIANSAGSEPFLEARPGDRHISYLPLAHIYERVTTVSLTHHGCGIGFYRQALVLRIVTDISFFMQSDVTQTQSVSRPTDTSQCEGVASE